MNFADQVVLITDLTTSISRAVALMLAERGACLALSHAEHTDAMRELVADCERLGGTGSVITATRTAGGVEQLVEAALERWGGLHALVVAHTPMPAVSIEALSLAQWTTTLEHTLHPAFHAAKAALRPMMRQRYGRIVSIAALYGLAGGVKQADYAAAMGGLIGMTRAAARELGYWRITVNAVAPGMIAGPELAVLPPEFVAWGQETVALQRLGEPQEVANVVCFLASSHASYITGQTLTVDGGWRIA